MTQRHAACSIVPFESLLHSRPRRPHLWRRAEPAEAGTRKRRRAYGGGHAREKARRQHVGALTLDEILDEMAGPQAMDMLMSGRVSVLGVGVVVVVVARREAPRQV